MFEKENKSGGGSFSRIASDLGLIDNGCQHEIWRAGNEKEIRELSSSVVGLVALFTCYKICYTLIL